MVMTAATRSPTERSDSQSLLTKLFSLPGGRPAVFLLRGFDNPNLVGRIGDHGGRITNNEADADVILTRSREEYRSLKDRYAVSRTTHVRMSGYVDRCVDAQRFVLAPIPGKRLPGRVPGARRNEFTPDDDEQLCQYIAEVLPEKEDGGRTGHFIYDDLMRRADQYGQYDWAQRHTKGSWRERYRKNQARLDQRIAEIVHENPPAPDGKGQYRSRRLGRFEEDEEDYALDAEAEAEEFEKSLTDEDEDPVLNKREGAPPQKEEEEEDEEEEQPPDHWPDDEFDPRDQDFHHEEEEEAHPEQRLPSPSPAPPTQRKGRGSQGRPPAPKRRKAAASQGREEEAPGPNDPDQTLLDDDELAKEDDEDDAPATPEPEIPTRVTRQTPRAAQPVSPRRTRASTRLRSVNPPAPPQSPIRRRAKATTTSPTTRRRRSVSADAPTVSKAKKSKSGAATSLAPVAESANDEFQAHSEDEGDMQEVEGTLREAGDSRARSRSLSSDDMQTSKRLRRARAVHDDDDDDDEEEEDEDDSDAELLAQVRKLDTRPPPTPVRASRRLNLNRVEDSEEEVLPSPGTRTQAKRSQRTKAQHVNVAPPSQDTRAAKGKARETAPRRRLG